MTPPFDQNSINTEERYDRGSSLNGSLGAPRTPRTPRGVFSKAVENIVMNSPLKALSDAAKRLFSDEIQGGQPKTLIFLSPSKRIPKRAQLVSVDTR